MEAKITDRLDTVSADAWNALTGADRIPFLRHEFLAALERHGCVGEKWGWRPHHLLLKTHGRLIGAVPMYLKDNSYGEFVFDWSWAEAYRRSGLRYYPKLVIGIPYTPVTGPRLLVHPLEDADAVRQGLIRGALAHAEEIGVPSQHWLFTQEPDTRQLAANGLTRRLGYQFHWHNPGYRDFDDFLDRFTASKRKKVKRERRRVQEAGITLEVLTGGEVTPEQWKQFHDFYVDTFDKRGGYPTLTADFFEEIGRTLPDQVVLILARHGNRYVAGSLSLRSDTTLYGRHWGCREEFHSLHFEACYYAGIDYCIRHGLARFEPGAQGEYKISRGFIPIQTWSAHWIADPGFRKAVERFTEEEQRLVRKYLSELNDHLPYRDYRAEAS